MALRSIPLGSSSMFAGQSQNDDYTYDINPQTVLRDPRFLKDYRDYRRHRGDPVDDLSDDDLIEEFYSDRTWRNNNTVSMARDLYEANTADAPQAQRLARIQKVWENAPTRDFFDALPDYAGALLLDPVNLLGGAGAAAGGVKAAMAGKTGWRAAAEVAKRAAVTEAAVNAPIAGGQDLLMQARAKEVGAQDEINLTQAAGSAVVGGLTGGLMGGGIGVAAAGAGRAARALGIEEARTPLAAGRKLVADAQALGATPDQIAALSPAQLEAFVRAGVPVPPPTPAADPTSPATPATPAPMSEAEQFRAEFNAEAVNANLANAQARLAEVIDDPEVSTAVKRDAVKQVEIAVQIQQLGLQVQTMQDKLYKAAASDNGKVAAAASRRIGEIQTALARYRNLTRSENLEEIKAARAEIEALNQSQEAEAAAETATEAATPAAEGGEAAAPTEAAAPADGAEAPTPVAPSLEDLTTVTPDSAEAPIETATVAAPKKGKKGKKAAAAEAAPEPAPAQDAAAVNAAYDEIEEVLRFIQNPEQRASTFVAMAYGSFGDVADGVIARLKTENPNLAAVIDAAPKPNVVNRMGASMQEQLEKLYGDLYTRTRDAALARGVSRENAEKIANREVDRQKSIEATAKAAQEATPTEYVPSTTPQSSSAARAADVLATGPVTAGQTARGRPQDILRAGRRADVADDTPDTTPSKPTAEVDIPRRSAAEIEQDVEDYRLARVQFHRQKGLVFEEAKAIAQREADARRDALRGIENRVASIKSAPAEKVAPNPRATRDTSAYRLEGESEANRTMTDGDVPTRSQMSREEFEALMLRPPSPGITYKKAIEKGQITEDVYRRYAEDRVSNGENASQDDWYIPPTEYGGVQPWAANTEVKNVIGAQPFQRTNKKTGRTYTVERTAKRGQTIWFNSQTRKWYATEDLANAASGYKTRVSIPTDTPTKPPTPTGLPEPPAPRARTRAPEAEGIELPTTKARTPEEITAAFMARVSAGEALTPEDFKVFQDELLAAQRKPDPVPVPAPVEGRVLAIRHRENGSVRVLTKAQAERGEGYARLLGSKGKAEEWEVGSVPEGTPSMSRRAAEAFSAYSEEDIAKAGVVDTGGPSGVRFEDIADDSKADDFSYVTLSEDEAKQLRDAGIAIRRRAENTTGQLALRDLLGISAAMESMGWPATQAGRARIAAHLANLYRIEQRVLPGGVIRNTASRAEANNAITEIFNRYAPTQIEAARRFLDGLAGEARPVFTEGRGNGYTALAGDGTDNTITLARASRATGLETLYHETAHWAYRNILTPEDRLQFWEAMSKYYDDAGNLDGAAVAPRTSDPNRVVNAGASPQEFFANQFVAAAMRKEGPLWQDVSFWDKITNYVKAAIDRFFGKDFIDPDLEPLFAKIMPDDAEMARRSEPVLTPKTPDSEFKSPQTKFAILSHSEIDDAYARLRTSIVGDDETGAIDAARDIITTFARLTSEGNAFGMIRGYEKTMQNLARRIWKAIYNKDGMAALDEDASLDPAFLADMSGKFSLESTEGAADRLGRLIFDGGRFENEIDSRGAMGALLPQILHKLERNITDAEGKGVIELRSRDWSKTWPDELDAYSKGAADTLRASREARAKRFNQRKAARNAAIEERKRKAEADPTPSPEAAAPATATSLSGPRAAATEQVLAGYKAAKTKAERSRYAEEIVRRVRTEPAAYTPAEATGTPISRSILGARKDEFPAMLEEALNNADSHRVNQIMLEVWRRGQRGPDGKPAYKAITLRDSRLNGAVNREKMDNIGESDGLGIPPSASPTMKAILNAVVGRTPDQTSTSRTLLYRALNMMNPTMQDALDNTSIVSVEDIYRLAGREPEPGVTGVFMDFNDPAFRELRGNMRRAAIGLTEGKSDPFDAMHEVFHLAVRTKLFSGEDAVVIERSFMDAVDGGERVARRIMAKYGSATNLDGMPRRQIRDLAEEWFAEQGALHAMGRVAKGDMFALRESGGVLQAKNRLMAFLERLLDGAAYLVNGLTGRNDIKQMFRRVYHYGDLFGGDTPRLSPPRRGHVTPEFAAEYFDQLINDMSPNRRAAMENYIPANGISRDEAGNVKLLYHGTPNAEGLTQPQAVMFSGSGVWGKGVYLSTAFRPAYDIYANAPTLRATTTRAAELASTGRIRAEDVDDVSRSLERLSVLRSARNRTPDVLENINNELSLLSELGYFEEREVFAYVSSAHRPFDLTQGATYDIEESQPMLMELARRTMADVSQKTGQNYLDDPEDFYFFIEEMATARDGEPMVNGEELYKSLITWVTSQTGIRNPRAHISKAIGDLGFDSLKTTHTNTTGEGRMSYDAFVLIDHYDEALGRAVSASELLKSIDSADFAEGDPRLLYSKLGNVDNFNGDIVNAMAEGRIDNPNPLAFANLLSPQAPKPLNDLMTSMLLRKRPGDVEKKNAVTWMTAMFGAQSTRLQKAGMNYLSRFHAQHYVDQHIAVAERVLPLKGMLDKLPDADKGFKRWLKNSNPVNNPAQPQSHARIVRALRLGLDDAATARLSAQEKAVAFSIRDALEKELVTLKKSGVIMGEIENYFPQVWSVQRLTKEPDKAARAFANYFMAEAKRDGRTEAAGAALERAERFIANLTTEDGFYAPPPLGASREATGDSIDFQRLIRMDDPDFRANLVELMPFLEDDLETILVKYFDASTRRSLQSAYFGTLNHGYFDYLRAVEEGKRGIAYLLSHNRVSRKDVRSISPDGYSTIIEWRDETTMPFDASYQGKDAMAAAEKAVEIYEKQGSPAAKAYLMSLDKSGGPRKGRYAPTTSVYEHRVNAIIAAIEDFGGQERQVPSAELRFAQDALRVATKKPVDNGVLSTDGIRKTSQAIRAFNAVSLLSFTVLASIPDLVMPTIRSGSFKTHAKTIAKYATDPFYREAIRASGVAIESVLHQRMTGMFGADATGRTGRAMTGFFNATLLTPWTDMNREISGAVGYEMFKADIKKALSLQVGNGENIASQPPEYKRIMRRLAHYGLADYVRRGEGIDGIEALDTPEVRKAILRFANETIFSPSPDDMPLWTNTPLGAIVWQLKSFPLMMSRLAGDMIADVKRGELKRPAYFMLFGGAAGAATLAIRDLAQQRGENEEATLRHRNINLVFGGDEKTYGQQDDVMGWYLEGMLAMGGFGLVADLLHTTATSADNGAYGSQRIMSQVFGPSVGTFASAVNVLGGAQDALMDSTPNSNAKERTAVREIARRVPVLGAMGAPREAVVDAVAGPSGDDAAPQVSDTPAEPEDIYTSPYDETAEGM
jgi:hypothetical protein